MVLRKYFNLVAYVGLVLVAVIVADSLATKPSSITVSKNERYTFACFNDNYALDKDLITLVDSGCKVVSGIVNESSKPLNLTPAITPTNTLAGSDNSSSTAATNNKKPFISPLKPTRLQQMWSFDLTNSGTLFRFNEAMFYAAESACPTADISGLDSIQVEQPFKIIEDSDFKVVEFTQKQGEPITQAIKKPQLSEAYRQLLAKMPVRKEALSDRQFYLLLDKEDQLKAVKVVRDNNYAEFVLMQDKDDVKFISETSAIEAKSFQRYPVNFSRINSKFNLRRKHPISKRIRPHKGVDLKAPYGAPVWTTYDGVVSFAGRQRGYGLIVEIDHQNGYKTKYAHLSKIPKGIYKGKHVSTKQVVGYVGNSGLSSGAHLHYEVLVQGKAKNPLKVQLPVAQEISDELKKSINTYLPKLNLMIKQS